MFGQYFCRLCASLLFLIISYVHAEESTVRTTLFRFFKKEKKKKRKKKANPKKTNQKPNQRLVTAKLIKRARSLLDTYTVPQAIIKSQRKTGHMKAQSLSH